MKPGDLVRLVRKITPYNAPQMGENSELWYTINPGEVGMLVERTNTLSGLFLFSGHRVIARVDMFEVVQ
jgi:hypothetical protein